MTELKITVKQLESLLFEQKIKVIEKLLGQTGYYNSESDAGNYRSLPIDKDKFKETGLAASFPEDLNVLKKYVD
jgi:hypothetical protein